MTPRDKLILRKLSVTEEWQVIGRLARELLDDIKARPKLKDTEWDTLRATIGDEGEIRGITNLIQAVHRNANEAK